MSYWKLKKSRVAGKVPTLNEIDLDTIVLNQRDGIAYVVKIKADNSLEVVALNGAGSTLPADMWQSSVAAQISALDEKESIADADNFVIDDSADDNKKKRITWTRVKSILKTYFDTLYNNFSISKATGAEINTGTDDAKYVTAKSVADSNIFVRVKANQIKDTTEKTTIADNDRFLIDDSETYYAKKSLKWSTIFTKLSGLFFGNVASQFSAIDEKTTTASADLIIIEDSGDDFKKKKYKLGTFIAAMKGYFDTLYNNFSISKATGAEINTGTDDAKYVTPKSVADSNIFVREKANQIKDTTEKTTIADNDRFLIDDSEEYYAKKSLKWSTIFTKLSGSFFGNVASQFSAITEKTGYAANDILIIEDSADDNKKKKYKFSTFMEKVLLMGFWIADTNGIKTSNNVAVNTASRSNAAIVSEGTNGIIAYGTSPDATAPIAGTFITDSANINSKGVEVLSNAGISGRFISNSNIAGEFISSGIHASQHVSNYENTNDVRTVLRIVRTSASLGADGIGGLIEFGIQNAAGVIIYPAYIGPRLTNATTGAAEFLFYLGSTVRAKITENFDFQLTEGSYIVPSTQAYYLGEKSIDGSWRIARSGADLVMQKRVSGTWVTKQTITG